MKSAMKAVSVGSDGFCPFLPTSLRQRSVVIKDPYGEADTTWHRLKCQAWKRKGSLESHQGDETRWRLRWSRWSSIHYHE